MPTTFPIFFIFLTFSVKCSTASGMRNGRRILHQPFFPNGLASPPSPPPSPKLPFTTSTPENSPFFPSFPSPPPPPPPSTFASFPANISSLDVPHSTRSNSASPKLVAVAIVALVAAVLFSAAAIFWFCRRTRLVEDDKTQRSESSHLTLPPNPPKLRNPSATSSEFLYLGTLVNSRAIEEQQRGGAPSARGMNNRSSGSISRKLDSPELRPLPPLVRQQPPQQPQEQPPQQQESEQKSDVSSNAVTRDGDENEEEFYSPRGSLGRRSSSIGAGSGSRREFFSAAEVDKIQGKIGKLSSTSSSSSSASSGSPVRSPSISISPPASLSPRRPKSPELLVMATPPMPQPPNLRPIMTAQFDSESNSSMSSCPALKNITLDSPSMSTDSDERLRPLPELLSPVRGTHFTPPPPPPPPPFMMQWETPKPSPRKVSPVPITKPPVLVTPLKPLVKSSNDVSPLELPSAKSDASENNEDTPKPKLKPLHWDKVRANSDREMVWDQLKSSSFK